MALALQEKITVKPMTIRLPVDLAARLDKLTKATGRNKSALTVAALEDYVDAEAWQIHDTLEGLAEADRGEFASDEEVSAFFSKHGG